MRVLVSKPRRKSTWVRTSNNNPLSCFSAMFLNHFVVHCCDKCCQISQSLLGWKQGKVFCRPVFLELWFSIESMFQNIHRRLMRSCHHKREHSSFRHWACVFSADVDEDWSWWWSPVLFIDPVSLHVGWVIHVVKMVLNVFIGHLCKLFGVYIRKRIESLSWK